MISKVIKNGTVVTADLTYKADVKIDGDIIVEIGPNLSGDEVLDATGCYIMPGGIDPHTHLEMPFMGTYSADDFESGTRAGLSGGTTMVVDFCLPSPNQSLLEALKMWDNKTGKASADYSFHMAITWWGEQVFNEMADVVDRGITSFKHFMAYKGALMVNDDEMFSSFQRCADLGALPLVHAENGDVVAAMTAKLLAEGNNGPEAHAYSRPPEVEGEATNRAIMIADMAGVPLYVVHVSSEQAHEAIRRARQKGMRVYGEPLVQHLTLDESEYFNADWDHAARRVMSPPFRNKSHQDSLWAGLQAGSLSCVATDHCAFTTAQKRNGIGNFSKIPNGTGGLEDRLPVLWTAGVNTGRLTMNEFVAVTSTNIAKILGLYPKKGAVLVGADADLVVWDPKRSKTITAANQQSSIDYNVFEGFAVTGLPRFVLSRGKVSIVENEIRAEPGHGKFVGREAKNPVNRALSQWKELVAPRKVERTGIPATGGLIVVDGSPAVSFGEAFQRAIENGATLTVTQKSRYLDLSENELRIYAALGKYVSEVAQLEFNLDEFIFLFANNFKKAAASITPGFPFTIEDKAAFFVYAHVLYPKLRECGDLEGNMNLHYLYYGLLELFGQRNGIVHGDVFFLRSKKVDSLIEARRHRRLSKDVYNVETVAYGSKYLERALQDIHYLQTFVRRAKRVLEGDMYLSRERDELLRGQANIREVHKAIAASQSAEAAS